MSDSESRTTQIRVLVADSSRIHTHLLAEALKRDAQFEAIPFDLESPRLAAVAIGLDADVLVISANLDEQPSRGFEILRELRSVSSKVRAVVLMDSLNDEMVLSAFRAGAKGIFGKNQPVEVLRQCVRCVHEGQVWANTREMSLAVEALASTSNRTVNTRGLSLLSKREIQVVQCLAEGLSNREIAKALGISQISVGVIVHRARQQLRKELRPYLRP